MFIPLTRTTTVIPAISFLCCFVFVFAFHPRTRIPRYCLLLRLRLCRRLHSRLRFRLRPLRPLHLRLRPRLGLRLSFSSWAASSAPTCCCRRAAAPHSHFAPCASCAANVLRPCSACPQRACVAHPRTEHGSLAMSLERTLIGVAKRRLPFGILSCVASEPHGLAAVPAGQGRCPSRSGP